jgi:hypothetical protein
MITSDIQKKVKLYNGEIEMIYNDKGHKYIIDGQSVLGVTTILSVINKPALIQWAANTVIEYLQIKMKAGEKLDELQLKNLFTEAKKYNRTLKNQAADLGTLIHNWIEEYIKGKNPAPLVNETAKKSIDSFLAWVKEKNVKFTESEKIIYSKKYKYAGTCDFTCEIDGKKYVGDLKTSKGIYDEYLLQVSAYRYALQEEFGKEYDGMLIIRIPKVENDVVEVKFFNNYKQCAEAFLQALGLYRNLQFIKNFMKGGEKQ